jgi:hypothetical protein
MRVVAIRPTAAGKVGRLVYALSTEGGDPVASNLMALPLAVGVSKITILQLSFLKEANPRPARRCGEKSFPAWIWLTGTRGQTGGIHLFPI